eukprot:Hpha_TRINITY_DN13508_c0_g4::TRINITY_DN13508_c0_g4_i2::g.111671::m.111671
MGDVEVTIEPMGGHGGSTITVRCSLEGADSVHLLRQAICAADGTPPELQRLVYSSRPLPHGPREKSLFQLGIRDGATIFISRERAVKCQLVIKSPTGLVFTYVVESPATETVMSVREAVHKEWGYEMGSLRLGLQGTEEPLDDEVTVSGVGLARGGGLVLIGEPGGAAAASVNIVPDLGPPAPGADLGPSAPAAEFTQGLADDLADLLEDEAMDDYTEDLIRAGVRTCASASACPLDELPPQMPRTAKRVLIQRATERAKGICVPRLLPDEAPFSVRMAGDLVRMLKEENMTDYADDLSKEGIRSIFALQIVETRDFPEGLPAPVRKLLLARGQGEHRRETAGSLQGGFVTTDLWGVLVTECLTDYDNGLNRSGIRTLDSLSFAELNELPDEMPPAAQRALMEHRPPRKGD